MSECSERIGWLSSQTHDDAEHSEVAGMSECCERIGWLSSQTHDDAEHSEVAA
ncbi:hypothetical protein I0C86_18065 [Plantactinospora sp. S1510]|uniref:Uncharacterized protein n=1 Tax=Plantactinospora alkalitolerans TaxID=2789879 RepID=A0ABS0GXB6_9ACTN|nr:hypothetical protein [Plantactinospora alkalitolerans]MBF9130849.1 hypothetical protein [Plantactinospora alkalitolerans]